MKKLDLTPYTVTIWDAGDDRTRTERVIDYPLKKNLADLMCSPGCRLNGRDQIKAGRVADKIEACTQNQIILEESEFRYVGKILELEGLGRTHEELLRRIQDAETVDSSRLNEKKKGGSGDE